jgi:DNA-binding transcriptional MerR regulator
MYVWTDVQRRMQQAFSITEAAAIFNKHRMTIDEYIREGMIKAPQRTYNIENNSPGKYMFSEDDMLDLHEFIVERRGNHAMNRQEIEALVRSNRMLYTEVDGQLVPVWKERNW